ncbi:MAG: stage III sporulation protein AF [Butyricicoccaceae bacterium]
MIAAFQHVIICITTAAIFLAVLMAFVPNGAIREIVRLAGGMVLILSLVTPLRNLRITEILHSMGEPESFSAEQTEQDAQEWNQAYITEQIEHYISQKTQEMGIDCTVTILTEMKEDGIALTGAEVTYHIAVDEAEKKKVEELMKDECGITNIQHRGP